MTDPISIMGGRGGTVLAGASRGADRASQRQFLETLGRAGVGLERAANGPDDAERAARQLVAVSLVQPALKQMREGTWAAPPFAPSSGERQFRALMDAELAQDLVDHSRWPLVDRLARDVRERLQPGPEAS